MYTMRPDLSIYTQATPLAHHAPWDARLLSAAQITSALRQSLQYHSFCNNMRLAFLFIATLAGTALAGPLYSDVDVRAHLAQGPVSINDGQEDTRGFSHRGSHQRPISEDSASVYSFLSAKDA